MSNPLHSRAGLLLYRQLPEEYRYRDGGAPAGELGDLEAYLHGHGALLDLLRGTLEQLYADGFAEPADTGGPSPHARTIQPWLLPYLAELVGAELISPDPAARTGELAQAVGWYKAKGTLGAIDSIADVVAKAETFTAEGWQRTLTTPRQALPPFTMARSAVGDGDPLGPTPMPLGTPDARRHNRAVLDTAGSNPLMTLRLSRRDAQGLSAARQALAWKPSARTGAPCFPGAFDDVSLRAPDLRDPDRTDQVGPNPKRTLVYVQPPAGFFEEGLLTLVPSGADPLGLAGRPDPVVLGAREVADALQPAGAPHPQALDRVVIDGGLTIPPDRDVTLEDVNVTGQIRVGVRSVLRLRRCAVNTVTLPTLAAEPSLDARDSLLDQLTAPLNGGNPDGFARLEFVTVLTSVRLKRLEASDCILAGGVNPDICADGAGTCIRYSRVPDLLAASDCLLAKAQHNTTAQALFLPRPLPQAGGCAIRQPNFGEAGAGVLSHHAPAAVRAGAEPGGEMGAYHHRFYAASLDALARKLADFLPLGQSLAIAYDARLALAPPRII